MKPPILRAAIAVVRLWTHIYTYRLPCALREARRAEVASDIWHSVHDPDRGSPSRLALHVILRLLLGVPDDLGWRLEQSNAPTSPQARAALAGVAVGVVALAMVSAFLRIQSPALPHPLQVRVDTTLAPPRPAPAEPFDRATGSPPSGLKPEYGQASYTVTTNAVAPVLIKAVRPVYPPIAAVNDLKGVVVVEATITEAGRVADARVVQPAGLLTQSAIDAVRLWEFAPGDSSGTVVKSLLTVKVKFTRP
jgi:TonB family protein